MRSGLGARRSRLGRAVVAFAVVASSLSWSLQAQTAKTEPASAKASTRPRPASRAQDVNRRNVDGSTPLQWAVYNGDLGEARRLLKAGADVTLANNYGATPMTLAA